MAFHVVVLLVGVALAVASRPAAALGPEDCALWIEQLGGEVAGADIAGGQAADSRKAILHEIGAARRSVYQSTDASQRRVQRIQRQTAELIAQGRVSHVEGERLTTLAEAARRCLEHMQAP
jgi:hypothetical protein